jgi:hypothetical protein
MWSFRRAGVEGDLLGLQLLLLREPLLGRRLIQDGFGSRDQRPVVHADAEVERLLVRHDCARIVLPPAGPAHQLVQPNRSGPPISRIPAGFPRAVRPTSAATSSAAMGRNCTDGRRTSPSIVLKLAIAPRNAKNCVAPTIE